MLPVSHRHLLIFKISYRFNACSQTQAGRELKIETNKRYLLGHHHRKDKVCNRFNKSWCTFAPAQMYTFIHKNGRRAKKLNLRRWNMSPVLKKKVQVQARHLASRSPEFKFAWFLIIMDQSHVAELIYWGASLTDHLVQDISSSLIGIGLLLCFWELICEQSNLALVLFLYNVVHGIFGTLVEDLSLSSPPLRTNFHKIGANPLWGYRK
jgi:hypothetical protein